MTLSKLSHPIVPNPKFSWRSLCEFIGFLESFTCIQPILLSPIFDSNSLK